MSPEELRELLDSDPRVVLVDVREPVEWDINHIDGAVLIPRSSIDSGDGLARLPADRIPVLYCKTGVRSAEILPVVHWGRPPRSAASARRYQRVGRGVRTRHGHVLTRDTAGQRPGTGTSRR